MKSFGKTIATVEPIRQFIRGMHALSLLGLLTTVREVAQFFTLLYEITGILCESNGANQHGTNRDDGDWDWSLTLPQAWDVDKLNGSLNTVRSADIKEHHLD